MTILNVGLARDRAAIVADELGIWECEGCLAAGQHLARCQCYTATRSKVVILPHLSAMAAFFGEGVLGNEMAISLNESPEQPEIMAQLAELRSTLQRWSRRLKVDSADNVAIIVHQADSGRLAAWRLQWPSFGAVELSPGVHLMPDPGTGGLYGYVPALRWADIERTLSDAVERQNTLPNYVSGGRLHVASLGPSGFHVCRATALVRNVPVHNTLKLEAARGGRSTPVTVSNTPARSCRASYSTAGCESARVIDPAAAWLQAMLRYGETAIELRQAGHTWPEISAELHLGDIPTAQRAAALFLAGDYGNRRSASEAAP